MVAFNRDFLDAKWVDECMDRHSFCNSSTGIRCYCPSMYIRHNEKFWAKVDLWDTFEKGICGQVCLGLESPLIFKPESDARNSCPFSASWTGCGNEVSWGPGCSEIAWFLRVSVQAYESRDRCTGCWGWSSARSSELPGLLVFLGVGGERMIIKEFHLYPGTKLQHTETFWLKNPGSWEDV